MRVIRQNIIVFAFGLNALAVTMASLGTLSPAAAAILHQVGSLLVLLNAMRLLVFGDWAELPPLRQLHVAGRRINRLDDSLDLEPVWRWCLLHRKGIAGSGLGLLAFLYAASGITAVTPGEADLVQRFGGYFGIDE